MGTSYPWISNIKQEQLYKAHAILSQQLHLVIFKSLEPFKIYLIFQDLVRLTKMFI